MNQTAGLFQRMYNNTVPMLQRMEQNCDWKSPYGLQTDLLLTLSLIFHRITLSLSGKESWRKTSSSSSSLLSFPSVGGWYILRLATTTNYIRYLVPGTLVLVPGASSFQTPTCMSNPSNAAKKQTFSSTSWIKSK